MNERQILALLKTGQVAFRYPLKLHYQAGTGQFGVSVPKRHFKRAVKRNLLKRRIRESYRRQKTLVSPGTDILFMYTLREVLPYEAIYADMTKALESLGNE